MLELDDDDDDDDDDDEDDDDDDEFDEDEDDEEDEDELTMMGFPSHSGADSLPPKADSRVLYVPTKFPFLPFFLSWRPFKLYILLTCISIERAFCSLIRAYSMNFSTQLL